MTTRSIDVRFILSAIVELAGVAALVWGCSLIVPFLGFIVGGIMLFILGLAIDPPKRVKPEVNE